MRCIRWLRGTSSQQRKEVSTIKQIELQQTNHLLKTPVNSAAELDPGQQQIGTHRNPDLGQHRISGRAEKGLDLEILLDALEEQLDLPPRFVNVSDGLCRQAEMVGQKHVMLTSLRIAVTNAAQRNRTCVGLGAGDENGLVTGQAAALADITSLDDTVSRVALLPDDEENSLVIQGIKPSEVGIRAIHDDNTISWQCQGTANGDIVGLAIGNSDEAGQQTLMIESDVEFDSALGAAEFGPGKYRQAQVDGRRVYGVELVLKAKAVPRGDALAAG